MKEPRHRAHHGQGWLARSLTFIRHRYAVACLLGVITTTALAVGHRNVGYVRDEGIYFEASRHYATWLARAATDPAHLFDTKARDAAFEVNHEHPALLKLAAGISARLFASAPPSGVAKSERGTDVTTGGWLPLMREGAAMRLPAQMVAGLGVAMLLAAGWARAGPLAGCLAAGWFILLPRVAFHAGLHCFDVPIAVLIFAVVLAYRRALVDARWGRWLGPIFGAALAVKHNAIFVLPLCLTHYYAVLAWARWRGDCRLSWKRALPLPIASLVFIGPLVAFLCWPWLWNDPLVRLDEYLAFHQQHAYYNIEYASENHNRPPLPISYPFVMTWATVPSSLLLLALGGLVMWLRNDLIGRVDLSSTPPSPRPPRVVSWREPLRTDEPRLDGLLLLLFALFPLGVIAWPTVPIFGGTKHWLTAYPLLALAAVESWAWLWGRAPARSRRFAPAVLGLVLLPSAWATWHGHPHNLSQYAPLVGGARGAAEAGHARGFWGHAALPLLDDLAMSEPRTKRRLFLHDMHPLARKQYRREHRWPSGMKTGRVNRSDAALFFHERHTLTDELEIWRYLGTRAPRRMVALDDVPLSWSYASTNSE